ncbi:eotaxin-like [Limanda limanda]|uniref:eotaxin-like n=1 Tax=Limanda limanda TaxID=27771 RepID=UPI0029C90DE2|nr:eotaxin-like [Limanda limanda]
MRSPHILLLCVLGAALLSSVLCNNALGPVACCFKLKNYEDPPLKRARISSYQRTDPNCPKKGVVFTTKNKSVICVHANLEWVQDIMNKLDEESL